MIVRWLRSLGTQLRDTYRLGVSMAWVCPPIFLLIVLPEFAQHIQEISLGMHAIEVPRPSAADVAMFWRFAYLKVAGLTLGMLLTFRFWMKEASLRRALRFGWADLGRIAIAILAFVLIGLVTDYGQPALQALGLGEGAAANADMVLDAVLIVPQVLLLPWLLAALGGDASMTLRRSARAGLRNFFNVVILLPAAFVPAAALHQWLHVVAKGAAPAPLWALMTLDSLVVGLLGTLVGSALYVFYRDAAAEGAK